MKNKLLHMQSVSRIQVLAYFYFEAEADSEAKQRERGTVSRVGIHSLVWPGLVIYLIWSSRINYLTSYPKCFR